MVQRRATASAKEKLQTNKVAKKNLKKRSSSGRVNQQHAKLVNILCENSHFCRLICRLNNKNNKNSLSKALADASNRIIDEHAHRRRRYVFSQSQLAHLETEFGYNHFIPTMRLQQLAFELSIDKLTLRSWFSRRRYRERRNRQIQPFPPVMHYFGPPYPFQAIAG
ncbi:unnamed protein product [Rotaria magnacalcarata]|uniref:Homeobox domain-containing protein n=1 Tax=Rotaria magnacalcarata TaxID=392030 RepID=A0A815ZS14_9BILA|nr:unnamed protein product [Rotaria magnacalcarata]CAF1597513.1 unnamed protein product [Rotaria magnacalcarata]CAF2132158.1 unnamed protein product [Rotaria magnacalcarata]CAF2144583.1 unnamed protein product [Rotaria magnacalcarata]CAF2193955.1 unnamed protein product [Rotaria magnacalcarata]